VWPLAAFGGTAAATAIPFGLTCVLAAVLLRPSLGGSLDRSLIAIGGILALQLVPLPGALVGLLSPAADDLRRGLSLGAGHSGGFFPISIDVRSTLWALTVFAGSIAIFWSARTQFRQGGVRQIVRLISMLGFAVSVLAIAQAATAGRRIYWRFSTEFEGPLPFGPFINRNHFATWAIMALPLVLGYLAARAGTRGGRPAHVSGRARIAHMIDPRTAWLTAAAVAILVALLLSLSRSGMTALALSGTLTFVLARRRLDRQRRRGLIATGVVVLLLGLAWADIPALRERFAGTSTGISNRMTIWRETVPAVRDFPVAGTGAGTYQRAMFMYQRSDRTVFYNQAHNHYLQAAVEGGALLLAALILCLAALVRTARRRLSEDTSALLWIRIGAACGLGAVALQSAWETGLVMPANAALAAVLTAIVVCEPRKESLTTTAPTAPISGRP
jgi:putative inorganic carbon (HCO3(-)) transporter